MFEATDWIKIDDILPTDFTITNAPDIIRKQTPWPGFFLIDRISENSFLKLNKFLDFSHGLRL